jgi:glyoxylase-like metal-dependent hydrolase (beta-lactamase superfamily II)
MTKRALWIGFLMVVCLAAACRNGGGSDDTGDDDARPDAGINPTDVTIYQVQQVVEADGPAFDVRGVVITAIDTYGHRVGNIWVQEPDGGPFSGVLVYGIDLSTVADLQLGDVIDLENVVKTEFALEDDDSGRTTTELVPGDGGIIVTLRDFASVPEPERVDALAIGRLPTAEERDAEWEKWEGVLITVENVSVILPLQQIGGAPHDPPFEEIRVTGPLRADTSLAAIAPVAVGDCLASITGIGDYFFTHKILPRDASAIVTGGVGCPEREAGDACDDEIDNDANGYADCEDRGCRLAVACQTASTVEDVQRGIATGVVNLTGVYVTAVDAIPNNLGFWVADAVEGAAYNGVFVYTGTTLPPDLKIGDVVDLTGQVVEFDLGSPPVGNTLTQIDVRQGSVDVTAADHEPLPLGGVAASILAHIDDGEPYEGVLVAVGPGVVTGIASGDRVTVTTATGVIVLDDDAYDYTASTYPVTTCLARVTGVMGLNITDDQRRLLPRRALDVEVDATGKACNP